MLALKHATRATSARKAAAPAIVQSRDFHGAAQKYAEALRRYGWRKVLWMLYNPGDVKFGHYVGQDDAGNKYYEDPTELHTMNRYTEYHLETFEEFDASQIPPEWHGWMHHITDAHPNDPRHSPEAWPHVKTASHSDAPYTNHLGPVQKPYVPHQTLARKRGYGVGSLLMDPHEKDRYWLQPNHPLRNRRLNNPLFEQVDYNNPEAPPQVSRTPLRPLDVN